MNRNEMLGRVREGSGKTWDFIIVGGGATGVGCAVDAAARGYSVLLLEQSDFGKGTSSRSTKLVHGGVRYLAQGNLSLVKDALRERGALLENAPHVVRKQAFVVPVYSYWDKFFYGTGLKTYNVLSGKYGFGKSRMLSKKETMRHLPNAKKENLEGGIIYYDGQFDDARLLINLAQTAAERGAALLNYARVFSLTKSAAGKIERVNFADEISGEIFSHKAKIVINATGAFCDAVRRMADGAAPELIAPSQGIHLVFDREFLASENALMIPKTSDGRILFAIPWQGKILVGTTDTPVEKPELEPKALEKEIEFILETVKDYLEKPPRRADVLSVFAGVRPLVKTESASNTAELARDHVIEISENGLLTVTGGKWTTYRRMAQDAVDRAVRLADLPFRESATRNLKIHGYTNNPAENDLAVYGADAAAIEKLIEETPALGEKLHEKLPYRKAEIVWAARNEFAQTVEDALARRTRALFLDARAAAETAPQAAKLLAEELDKDSSWVDEQIKQFETLAENYIVGSETERKSAQ